MGAHVCSKLTSFVKPYIKSTNMKLSRKQMSVKCEKQRNVLH